MELNMRRTVAFFFFFLCIGEIVAAPAAIKSCLQSDFTQYGLAEYTHVKQDITFYMGDAEELYVLIPDEYNDNIDYYIWASTEFIFATGSVGNLFSTFPFIMEERIANCTNPVIDSSSELYDCTQWSDGTAILTDFTVLLVNNLDGRCDDTPKITEASLPDYLSLANYASANDVTNEVVNREYVLWGRYSVDATPYYRCFKSIYEDTTICETHIWQNYTDGTVTRWVISQYVGQVDDALIYGYCDVDSAQSQTIDDCPLWYIDGLAAPEVMTQPESFENYEWETMCVQGASDPDHNGNYTLHTALLESYPAWYLDSEAMYFGFNDGVWVLSTSAALDSPTYSCTAGEVLQPQSCNFLWDGEPDIQIWNMSCPFVPTQAPTQEPTVSPTETPTDTPTDAPTTQPTLTPSSAPTNSPTVVPTSPTDAPTILPSSVPTESPVTTPTGAPVGTDPYQSPSSAPSSTPTQPTTAPTNSPVIHPSDSPTTTPVGTPTLIPTTVPTTSPTAPTQTPTSSPVTTPSDTPTATPTQIPTQPPSAGTGTPTETPTAAPTDPVEGTSEPMTQSFTQEAFGEYIAITIIVLLVLGCILIGCPILVCLWYRKRETGAGVVKEQTLNELRQNIKQDFEQAVKRVASVPTYDNTDPYTGPQPGSTVDPAELKADHNEDVVYVDDYDAGGRGTVGAPPPRPSRPGDSDRSSDVIVGVMSPGGPLEDDRKLADYDDADEEEKEFQGRRQLAAAGPYDGRGPTPRDGLPGVTGMGGGEGEGGIAAPAEGVEGEGGATGGGGGVTGAAQYGGGGYKQHDANYVEMAQYPQDDVAPAAAYGVGSYLEEKKDEREDVKKEGYFKHVTKGGYLDDFGKKSAAPSVVSAADLRSSVQSGQNNDDIELLSEHGSNPERPPIVMATDSSVAGGSGDDDLEDELFGGAESEEDEKAGQYPRPPARAATGSEPGSAAPSSEPGSSAPAPASVAPGPATSGAVLEEEDDDLENELFAAEEDDVLELGTQYTGAPRESLKDNDPQLMQLAQGASPLMVPMVPENESMVPDSTQITDMISPEEDKLELGTTYTGAARDSLQSNDPQLLAQQLSLSAVGRDGDAEEHHLDLGSVAGGSNIPPMSAQPHIPNIPSTSILKTRFAADATEESGLEIYEDDAKQDQLQDHDDGISPQAEVEEPDLLSELISPKGGDGAPDDAYAP